MDRSEERLRSLNRYLSDLIDEDVEDCNFYDICQTKSKISSIEEEIQGTNHK